MKRRNLSFVRALLLVFLVAVGPLQATAVFACGMMDTVVQGECCCDDHQPAPACTSSNCDAALQSTELPCCEQSVEVGIDDHASGDHPIFKPVEVRSDVDPPQALISSFDADLSPGASSAPCGFISVSADDHGGSDTYLVTQRLRL